MTIPDLIEAVARAIREAECPDREGPYGLYDYSCYPGREEPHRVRDFRDPRSSTYGDAVFSSNDRQEAELLYVKLTDEHIAQAAIQTILAELIKAGASDYRVTIPRNA